MNNRVANDMPKPLLRYIGDGKFTDMRNSVKDENVLQYWLFQDLGETYRLQWFGSGWVVFYQESYLTKDLKFTHKNDIPGFDFSHFPFAEAEKWQHVFETSNDAIEAFKKHYCKLRGIESCKDLRLYDKELPDYGDLFTVEDWKQAVDDGLFVNFDGSGYWVKDNKMSREDEVFSSPQLDATHVMWFNK